MDTLTALAAWTGAITGVGSLVVQYFVHRRTGAILRLEMQPVRYQQQHDGQTEVRELKVTVRNRGRHQVDIQDVYLENRRPLGRLGRWFYLRGIGRGGPARRAIWLSRGTRNVRIDGLSSQTFGVSTDRIAEQLGDQTDYLYPTVRTAAGRLVRGRRVSRSRILS